MTTFTMQDLQVETLEEKEAMDVISKRIPQVNISDGGRTVKYDDVIQGATGAQYSYVDTMADVKKPSVEVIINNICRELQALSTVITSYQANASVIKQLLDATIISYQNQTPPRKEGDDACGK